MIEFTIGAMILLGFIGGFIGGIVIGTIYAFKSGEKEIRQVMEKIIKDNNEVIDKINTKEEIKIGAFYGVDVSEEALKDYAIKNDIKRKEE